MIEKMKKYSFLIFHADYENFLERLRELGVLHIEATEKELSEDKLLNLNKIKRINGLISEMETLSSHAEPVSTKEYTARGEELLAIIEAKQKAINEISQELGSIQKEYSTVLPWGDFKPETIKAIEDAGYRLQFFICEAKGWDENWDTHADIALVNARQGELFLMAITSENEPPVSSPNLEEVSLTEPLSAYKTKLKACQEKQNKAEASLNEISQYAPAILKEYVQELEAELDFSLAIESGIKEADEKVVVLTGWIPAANESHFAQNLDKEGIVYLSDKAKPEDNMPVKLKNNSFSKLFESIGELYSLPNHRELDLTPFFAPFYMLFFGFCLGDAGYGLLMVLGTLYGMFKAQPKYKPLMKLGFCLGLATTIMGIVGGTFFGIMFGINEAGEPLQSVAWLREYQKYVLDMNNLMILSLILGYIQVLFGMTLKAVNLARMYGFRYSISQMGWIIVVGIAIPAFALGKQEIIPAQIANLIAIASIILGAIPALFYNTPGKNIFLNFGTGLWHTYGMVSGLLGDVLSYIRLFALGLASAILGNVFNSLAMQAQAGLDNIILGAIAMIVILSLGHSLNLFMALLGSFVHPLRLTFVEFYKNAGFEGGGQKYHPFSTKQ